MFASTFDTLEERWLAEVDSLVRRLLRERVAGAVPPARVWKSISAHLERQTRPKPPPSPDPLCVDQARQKRCP